ncbi:hypothetical protein BS78_08G153500 [Paspalum vaginatum]|nr:hypothetical protein BS78_08G153500 [Paspalum vaginatum]
MNGKIEPSKLLNYQKNQLYMTPNLNLLRVCTSYVTIWHGDCTMGPASTFL